MQRYNVPQFVEIEDKIIGPFTLRQFLVIVAGGIFVVLYWLIFEFSIPFWFLAVPTALLALFISLGQLNGRPVLSNVFPFLGFLIGAKRMFFQREATPDLIVTMQRKETKKADELDPREVQSRLKRLAYVLDEKIAQEEDLRTQSNKNS